MSTATVAFVATGSRERLGGTKYDSRNRHFGRHYIRQRSCRCDHTRCLLSEVINENTASEVSLINLTFGIYDDSERVGD